MMQAPWTSPSLTREEHLTILFRQYLNEVYGIGNYTRMGDGRWRHATEQEVWSRGRLFYWVIPSEIVPFPGGVEAVK